MKNILFTALVVVSAPSYAYRLISDPLPATDPQYSALSHCQFYFDSAPAVKVAVVSTGGKHCEIDLGTVTLSSGTHTAQATHLIDHPTTPLESVKSNSVTFTWPIPNPPTGTLQAPAGWRLVP
jgi:hypothetical protein